MKSFFLAATAFFIFMSAFGGQTADAQTKIPAKEAALIAHLVSQAKQPDAHSNGDVYLLVTVGKTAYTTELKSGKVVSQKRAANPSGGFSGAYAEVSLNLLDKAQQETSQGAGQLLKSSGGKWKRVALSEGDYQCTQLKSVPEATLKALKVECN